MEKEALKTERNLYISMSEHSKEQEGNGGCSLTGEFSFWARRNYQVKLNDADLRSNTFPGL